MKTYNNSQILLTKIDHDASDQIGLSVIFKATYRIIADEACRTFSEQLPFQADTVYLDDIGRSLVWSNDYVPYKPNFDLLITGSFFSPGRSHARSGHAAFEFGPLTKVLRITGPRTATRIEGKRYSVSEPIPITSVPLRWEYSFGGLSDRRNPFGLGLDATTGDRNTVRLPMIEAPDDPPWSPDQRPEPVNFAPVPTFFEKRRKKLGTRDRRWSLFRAPFPPADYDPSHANAAPDGQQAGNYPRGDEEFVLHNMHPDHPRLAGRLPGVTVALAAMRSGDTAAIPVVVNLDTVVIMPDKELVVLLWRGIVPCRTRSPMSEVIALECEAGTCDAPVDAALLAKRLTRRLKAAADAERDAEAARDAEGVAQIRTLLKDAALPPGLARFVATENDPALLQAALEKHLDVLVGQITAPPSS